MIQNLLLSDADSAIAAGAKMMHCFIVEFSAKYAINCSILIIIGTSYINTTSLWLLLSMSSRKCSHLGVRYCARTVSMRCIFSPPCFLCFIWQQSCPQWCLFVIVRKQCIISSTTEKRLIGCLVLIVTGLERWPWWVLLLGIFCRESCFELYDLYSL